MSYIDIFKVMSDLVAPEPEHCPGTGSEEAGKASACDGCPNQQICADSTPKGMVFFCG